MPRTSFRIAIMLFATSAPLAVAAAPIEQLKSLDLQVPSSDQLLPGSGPDVDAINNNCLACHSADHILNQPSLPRESWEEIVNKMIDAYKAPINSKDAAAIVDYLARTKGTN